MAKINKRELATDATIMEGRKHSCNVADVSEVQRCTMLRLAWLVKHGINKPSEILALVESYLDEV